MSAITRLRCAARAVIHSHNVADEWTTLGNALFIDTGAGYDDGYLTILDAATLRPAVRLIGPVNR